MPIRRGRKSRQRKTIDTLEFEDLDKVTFRDTEILDLFLSSQNKILPRRKTGITARHQRKIAREIKRARELGLLGYRGQH
ncbi:MAG: 30S ribosomal protein S18 [Candidatus Andersenbacteria bacterium]